MKVRNLDLETAKEVVAPILRECYAARDCDNLLLFIIWSKESLEIIGDFLTNFKEKKFSHPETIVRARRDLQLKNKDLRGDLWDKRHKLEAYVCAQLQFNFQGSLCH